VDIITVPDTSSTNWNWSGLTPTTSQWRQFTFDNFGDATPNGCQYFHSYIQTVQFGHTRLISNRMKNEQRPKLVYVLSKEQEAAIADYFFHKKNVKSLRELVPILKSSVQGASNISLRVLGQWAASGRVIINPNFK
jgi:hypothetical protein